MSVPFRWLTLCCVNLFNRHRTFRVNLVFYKAPIVGYPCNLLRYKRRLVILNRSDLVNQFELSRSEVDCVKGKGMANNSSEIRDIITFFFFFLRCLKTKRFLRPPNRVILVNQAFYRTSLEHDYKVCIKSNRSELRKHIYWQIFYSFPLKIFEVVPIGVDDPLVPDFPVPECPLEVCNP